MQRTIQLYRSEAKSKTPNDFIEKITIMPLEGNALILIGVGQNSDPIPIDEVVVTLKAWSNNVEDVDDMDRKPHFVHSSVLKECLGENTKVSSFKISKHITFHALDASTCNVLEKKGVYAIMLSDIRKAFIPPSLEFDTIQVEIHKKDQLMGLISHAPQQVIDAEVESRVMNILGYWKDNATYAHLDLIDGVGAADFIIIDVDSLISMALRKRNGLDWYEHGGQWLHLAWLCEKTLSVLKSRSVNFDIVCFKNSMLQRKSFDLFLARMVIFNHLERNCSLTCHLFESLYSKEWKLYVEQKNPSAIITTECVSTKVHLNVVDSIKYIVTNIEDGTKSVSGDVYSSIADVGISSLGLNNWTKYLSANSISNMLKLNESLQVENTLSQARDLTSDHSVSRITLCSSALLLLIKQSEKEELYSNLFYGFSVLYSIILLDFLPLEMRHFKLNETIEDLTDFIQKLYKYYSVIIFKADDWKDITCDLLDCRLAHWIILNFKSPKACSLNEWIQILCEKSPDQVSLKMNEIFGWIKDRISFDFDEVEEFSINPVSCTRYYKYLYNETDKCSVLGVKNDFINKFCDLQSTSNIELQERTKKPIFQDIYHYHSTKLIADDGQHLEKSKFPNDNTREKLNGMVNLFKKVNKCKDIATEQVPKDLRSLQLQMDYSQTPRLNSSDKQLLKTVQENFEKCQKALNNIKEIINKQEKLVKNKDEDEVTFSISELVSISKEIQENIELFKPILDKYIGKTLPKNDETIAFAKKIYIQLLDSFKYQIPKSRKPYESKLLQKTVEGPVSRIVLSDVDEQKGLHRLNHVNNWIRFIYSYLIELNNIFPYFTSTEIKREMENLSNSARMFGFCETAQLIEKSTSNKHVTSDEKDILNPNYLFLYHFEKSAPTVPQLELFTKKKHNIILNELIAKRNNLISKYNSSQKANYEILSHEIKKLNVQIKLRESLTFTPDDWQNELISYVNRDESVLVSVPTSNGKTFIVFYLIEKVLRESEDGVVLFVVPNKALVNQVYCEIQSRLKKNQNNVVTVGMATANTRLDVFNSQLLVIVPAMLEIYLMSSAPKVLEWRKRIKYLVLDEIHCITSDDQGEYYEHCIQLLDCPVIGLSATLGNGEKFAKWMSHGSREKVHLIYEPDYKRFNPLEYYTFNGTGFIHSHPCELFNSNHLTEKEIQKCRMMTIDECFELKSKLLEFDSSDEMKNIIETFVGFDLLNPNKLSCISWNDHIHYKLGYKSLMTYLVNNKYNVFEKVVKSFAKKLDNNEETDISQFIDDMISLINHLKQQKMLPAIVFILDRRIIDSLVRKMLRTGINLYENDETPQSDLVRIYQSLLGEASINSNSDERREGKKINDYYIKALYSGIGAHYAGLDEGYLIEIERLFREKKLPLIFTTSTLALGIHLPCKTVVMGGSSIYLTNSLFKQCCGRVGRRGIDQKGKVILYGLDHSIIRRYLLSEPITINGTVGLKPSFVLKMFSSLNETSEQVVAKNPFADSFERVLEKPLFCINESTMIQTQSQMSYFIRFHTEFLRQALYLNKKCQPLQLSGLISHLHYREPFNFLMAHFLQTRIFETLDINKIPEHEFDKIILTIITLLFARLKISKQDSTNMLETDFSENMANMFKKMKAENIYFNRETLKIYSNYAIAYCKSENLKDSFLPLSEVEFSLNVVEEDMNKEIFKVLKQKQSQHVHSISTFAAMSGNQDRKYLSEDHFFSTLKHTISINKAHVPFTRAISNKRLSCFLVDYYKHGSLEKLTRDHKFINIGASSKLVQDAIRDIKKFRSSLITEEIFSFTISDYDRKLDNAVASEWFVTQCKWLKNSRNLDLITFETLYNWLVKGTLEKELSSLFPIKGYGLKSLKKKIENRFAHPIIQSLDRILDKLEANERTENKKLFAKRLELVQKKKAFREDMDDVEMFKGLKFTKANSNF